MDILADAQSKVIHRHCAEISHEPDQLVIWTGTTMFSFSTCLNWHGRVYIFVYIYIYIYVYHDMS